MANLRTPGFASVYDTSINDIDSEFFVPALRVATRYDRGVGYFSSGWLRSVGEGLAEFAGHEGRMRLLTSPILDADDWEAIQIGQEAQEDAILRSVMLRNVKTLAAALAQDTLSALAWMIADEILVLRLALPTDKLSGGEFHTKFGVFSDHDDNVVSFEGSNNETVRGLRFNYERFKVYCSWKPEHREFVDADVATFAQLWENRDPNVRVYELPDAAREQILKLRTQDRPYPEPSWVREIRQARERGETYVRPRPYLPSGLELREYQNEAIQAWFDHKCRGLLEMATGTGKTITALAASVQLFETTQRLAVIITVPYQHLVDQWAEEAAQFGYHAILAYVSKRNWLDALNQQILDYVGGYRDFIAVIVTHTTFGDADFQASIARLRGPVLLIADEAHHLGAERSRQSYPDNVDYRLALSATPDRWFDDVGTQALRAYFGETVFEFGLEDAIGYSLTPYYYHPHLVPLTEDEMDEYESLSLKIARLMGSEDDEAQESLKRLLIRRANLLNRAANKISVLSDLVDEDPSIKHTLFYCAPGQIDEVVHLLGWEKGLWLNRFTAEENASERKELLSAFSSGEIQALVAMKCLDEGVDVPSTRTAYFLASSSNPREFIQRRGRILRKYPGKEHSVIHDLIAVPPDPVTADSPAFNAERGIMRRELQRFREFAGVAMNKHQATDIIWDLAAHYGLMDF